MKRIGIYGGAFNPPTIGHKHVVTSVLESGMVDEVWINPSYLHFHGKKMVSYAHRCMMCELMICDMTDNVSVMLLDRVIATNFPTFNGSTIEFMQYLRKLFTDFNHEYSIIIGQDNAETISTWNKGEELVNSERFIIIPRDDYQLTDQWYMKEPHHLLRNLHPFKVSSTEVREEIARIPENDVSDTLKHFLGHDVLAYVLNKNLYKE
jgi:nicotinate-nucleotide adenylyltransferase